MSNNRILCIKSQSNQNKQPSTYISFSESPLNCTQCHNQSPPHTKTLMKILLKLNLIQSHVNFKQYVLRGFDLQGKMIQQIKQLGFKGIQIGPTSYNASLDQDPQPTLGIKSVLANILSYKQRNKQQNFVLQLNISPNYQILRYTPYLLKQNIGQALQSYYQIQRMVGYQIVSQINININRRQMNVDSSQLNSIYLKIKQQLCKNRQYNQGRQICVDVRWDNDYKGYMQWEQFIGRIIDNKVI